MNNLIYRHGNSSSKDSAGKPIVETNWEKYRSKTILELTPWKEDININFHVRVSDSLNGSPKEGDMIAHKIDSPDYWLITKELIEQILEKVE